MQLKTLMNILKKHVNQAKDDTLEKKTYKWQPWLPFNSLHGRWIVACTMKFGNSFTNICKQ